MLTDQEKAILRQAICDGIFSNTGASPNGVAMRQPLTPDVLQAVSAMSDDTIKNTLTVYVASKKLQLQQQLTQIQTNENSIQAQINLLQTPIS